MRTLLILTLFGLAPLAGPQQPPAPAKAPSAPNAVVAVNQLQADLLSALTARDSLKLAGLFAHEADLVPPIGPSAHGREAIQGAWQRMFDLDARDYALTLTTAAAGNAVVGYQIGYVGGTYELTKPEGSGRRRETGAYLIGINRFNQGSWEIRYAIFRPETP